MLEVATVFHINKGAVVKKKMMTSQDKLTSPRALQARIRNQFRGLYFEGRIKRNDLRSFSSLVIGAEGSERGLQGSILVVEHLPVAGEDMELVDDGNHLQTNFSKSAAKCFFVFCTFSEVSDSSMRFAHDQSDELVGNGTIVN